MFEKLRKWAMERMSPQAAYEAGIDLKYNYRHDKAAPYFTHAAKQGHAGAQKACGEYCYNGTLGPVDYEKAMYWYTLAAEQNDYDAQYLLSQMYRDGKGCEVDLEKAHYWCEKAAELGKSEAQLYCGKDYEFGTGCEESHEKALYWYELAAKYSTQAMEVCLHVYETGFGVPADPEKAVYYAKKLCDDAFDKLNYYKRHNLQSFIPDAKKRADAAQRRLNSLQSQL